MGQAVDNCGDQNLVIDNLVPAIESEVRGDDGGLFVGAVENPGPDDPLDQVELTP